MRAGKKFSLSILTVLLLLTSSWGNEFHWSELIDADVFLPESFTEGNDLTAVIKIYNKSDQPIIFNDFHSLRGDVKYDEGSDTFIHNTYANLMSQPIFTSAIILPGKSYSIEKRYQGFTLNNEELNITLTFNQVSWDLLSKIAYFPSESDIRCIVYNHLSSDELYFVLNDNSELKLENIIIKWDNVPSNYYKEHVVSLKHSLNNIKKAFSLAQAQQVVNVKNVKDYYHSKTLNSWVFSDYNSNVYIVSTRKNYFFRNTSVKFFRYLDSISDKRFVKIYFPIWRTDFPLNQYLRDLGLEDTIDHLKYGIPTIMSKAKLPTLISLCQKYSLTFDITKDKNHGVYIKVN